MMDDEEEGDDKFDEAKKAIQTSVALWLPQYQVSNLGSCGMNAFSKNLAVAVSVGLRRLYR